MIRLTVIVGIMLMALTANASKDLLLPDPLITDSGEKITTSAEWEKTRRQEILELFRANVYGRCPVGRPDTLKFEVKEADKTAMEGRATLKRIDISFSGRGGEGTIKLTLFIPNNVQKPVAGFLLICNRDSENIDPARKIKSPFWPAERIVDRGYMAAAFHNSDLDPDTYDGFKDGVHGIFDAGDEKRPPDAWGTIAAWAWGASRVMDYFETDKDIDAKRIAVAGHSRGGKTALWCGAEDQRFALVISNNSGCTGAALSRRREGETVRKINESFPHWFCTNYRRFNDNEDALPVDQHQLIALMAPRPVCVASASEDLWADPEGEFLSCVHAGPVYELYGRRGLGTDVFPQTGKPLQEGCIGYHLRAGKHDLTEYDWDRYMDFADKHWNTNRQSPPGDSVKAAPEE